MTTRTTKPKLVDPLNGLIRLASGQEYPLARAVKLDKKIVLVVIAVGVEVAYQLLDGGCIKFLGYVGLNGPSRGKLKKAVPLDAKAIGAKLAPHVFEPI